MSLLEAFRAVDGGGISHDAVRRWLQRTYIGTDDHGDARMHHPARKQRELFARRLRFLRDDYEGDVLKMVDVIFDHKKVKEKKRRWARAAMSKNVTNDIVTKLASNYDRRPRRRFAVPGQSGAAERLLGAWLALARDLDLDAVYQEAERLLWICNTLVFWLVETPGGGLRVDLLTPSMMHLVPDPRDPGTMAGILIRLDPVTLSVDKARTDRRPHWEFWDDAYKYTLDRAGRWAGSERAAREQHGLGQVPGVVIHRRPRVASDDALIDLAAGGDILAAHEAVVFLHLSAMYLAKAQGERQPVLTGLLSRIAKGQAMDGEGPIALPPGTSLEMLEMRTDPEHYFKAVRHQIAQAEETYGLSIGGEKPEVPSDRLIELRMKGRDRFARIEPAVADMLGFPGDFLRVDYHDKRLPMDPKVELEVFETEAKWGLDDPVSFLMRRDPDLTEKEAQMQISRSMERTTRLLAVLAARGISVGADARDIASLAAAAGRLGPAMRDGQIRRVDLPMDSGEGDEGDAAS